MSGVGEGGAFKFRGGVVVQKRASPSPDFRSPEVGISAMDSAIERLNTLARTVFSNHGSKFFRKERGKTNVACLKKI